MSARRLAFLLTLFAPLVPLSSAGAQSSDEEWLARCERDRWNDERQRVCEVRELGFRAASRTLEIDAGQNGGIAIRGWDRDSVAVTARVQASARTTERAREIAEAIRVFAGPDGIRSTGPSEGSGHWAVSYVIYVPTQSAIRAETHNGPIGVRDVVGDLSLDAHNGPLSLRGVGGDVRARTMNGPLDVELDGERWNGRGLDAETRNGPVNLTIPSGYSARLETGTVNGPMRIDFPITVQGRLDRRITTELGEGGAPVRVITTNGPVVIRRG